MLAEFFQSESDRSREQPPELSPVQPRRPAPKQSSYREPSREGARAIPRLPPSDQSTSSTRSAPSRERYRAQATLDDLPPTLTEDEVLEFLGNFRYRLRKEIQMYWEEADARMSRIEELLRAFSPSHRRPR
jgi:hypothetical protein